MIDVQRRSMSRTGWNSASGSWLLQGELSEQPEKALPVGCRDASSAGQSGGLPVGADEKDDPSKVARQGTTP